MKNNLLTVLLLTLMYNLNAQVVDIPDANFKACLLENRNINLNGDDEIQVSEAEGFAGSIDCSGKDINDLTGIESFKSITQLSCFSNALTSLDLSQNTALKYLYLDRNKLTGIDLSNNTELLNLNCSNNQLSDLSISNNKKLSNLDCSFNRITSLNVSQNVALDSLICNNNALEALDIKNLSALRYLFCGNNHINSLDLTNKPFLDLVDCKVNPLTSMNLEGVILRSLNCSWNPSLSELNIPANSPLKILDCSDGQIKKLIFEGPSNLEVLNCGTNLIASLKTEHLSKIQEFRCHLNKLTSLDVSYCQSLVKFDCSVNLLRSLNVKNGNNSNMDIFIAFGNDDLACIQVDNAAYSDANWGNWTNRPAYAVFREDCNSVVGLSGNHTVSAVAVYPNPARDMLTIEGGERFVSYRLIDLAGQVADSNTLTGNTIHVSHIKPGLYMLVLRTTGGDSDKVLLTVQ